MRCCYPDTWRSRGHRSDVVGTGAQKWGLFLETVISHMGFMVMVFAAEPLPNTQVLLSTEMTVTWSQIWSSGDWGSENGKLLSWYMMTSHCLRGFMRAVILLNTEGSPDVVGTTESYLANALQIPNLSDIVRWYWKYSFHLTFREIPIWILPCGNDHMRESHSFIEYPRLLAWRQMYLNCTNCKHIKTVLPMLVAGTVDSARRHQAEWDDPLGPINPTRRYNQGDDNRGWYIENDFSVLKRITINVYIPLVLLYFKLLPWSGTFTHVYDTVKW